MGFVRLHAGRTTAVVDVVKPPPGPNAHASSLAFELSAGRRRLIVNCGSGAFYGEEWRRAGRATAAHSTLSIERTSSSRMSYADDDHHPAGEVFDEGPRKVTFERTEDVEGLWALASHDGYVATHGLTHERRLFLSPDGRDFRGEDTLAAVNARSRRLYDKAVAGAPRLGVSYAVRFHLHPDITATLSLGGQAVALRTPASEAWVMRQSGGELALEDSVYFDQERLRPRATKQIVVKATALEYWGRVTWAFRRADDGQRSTRDLVTETLSASDVASFES